MDVRIRPERLTETFCRLVEIDSPSYGEAAMAAALPAAGCELVTVPRLEIGGEPVSASRVRALLASGQAEAAAELMY